eukprot:SAG22_NODE_3562_length_1640_cov_2.134328_5_plen_102_part_00
MLVVEQLVDPGEAGLAVVLHRVAGRPGTVLDPAEGREAGAATGLAARLPVEPELGLAAWSSGTARKGTVLDRNTVEAQQKDSALLLTGRAVLGPAGGHAGH